MNKNEKIIFDKLNNSINSKVSFNDISSHINYSKYQSNKNIKKNNFFKISLLISSPIVIILIVCISIYLFNINQKPNNIDINYMTYNGYLETYFYEMISENPSILNSTTGLSISPIIDSYFYYIDDSVSSPSFKPNYSFITDIFILNKEITFNYVYEVEYKYNSMENKNICVYIEKEIANRIYAENKDNKDQLCVSDLTTIDGSISSWFFTNKYYNDTLIKWYQYESCENIAYEIDNYICVGVYRILDRKVIREIFSNKYLNIEDKIYLNEKYIYTDGLVNKVENNYEKITWYASNEIIEENTSANIISDILVNEFNCNIDISNNTIRLQTYAVQQTFNKDNYYLENIKEFHHESNKVIVENENPDKKFGELSFITYRYDKYVQLLQSMKIDNKGE